MDEENMMDDALPQTVRSESAFSGTSDDLRRPFEDRACNIPESNIGSLGYLLGKPLKATRYGHSLALLVPKRIIGEHKREDVLQVIVVKASDPTREFALYTTHLPGYKHAYLDLYQLDPSYREEYRVEKVNIYTLQEFARDYNMMKPIGLENTDMTWTGGRLVWGVDGKLVDLIEKKFRTYQGQVVLDCVLGEAGRVKFSGGLKEFQLRLRDHSPVDSAKARDNGVLLTYSRTNHDGYPHRRQVEGPTSGYRAKSGTLVEPIEIKLIIRPRLKDEPYVIEVSPVTLRRVVTSLGGIADIDEFRQAKGNIGEGLVCSIVPALGMVLVARHPVTPKWWQQESKKPGPDMLVRDERSGSLAYVEAKWWGNVCSALENGIEQARGDLRKYPEYRGETVAWSYVAVMEWNVDTRRLKMHLRKVSL